MKRAARGVGLAVAALGIFASGQAAAESFTTPTYQGCVLQHSEDVLERLIARVAPRRRAEIAGELSTVLLEAECAYGIDVHLLVALIERESHFDRFARGPRGSIGLMQVQPATAVAVSDQRGWGAIDESLLEDPRMNVRLGAVYLAAMFERFGEWETALTAYNMGPSRLSKRLRRGYSGTSPYARAILERREDLLRRTALLEVPELAENR